MIELFEANGVILSEIDCNDPHVSKNKNIEEGLKPFVVVGEHRGSLLRKGTIVYVHPRDVREAKFTDSSALDMQFNIAENNSRPFKFNSIERGTFIITCGFNIIMCVDTIDKKFFKLASSDGNGLYYQGILINKDNPLESSKRSYSFPFSPADMPFTGKLTLTYPSQDVIFTLKVKNGRIV